MSYERLYKYYDRFVGVCYDDLSVLIASVLKSFDIKGKVLDIACGTGELTKRLHDLKFDMVGLDISDKMLEKAREKCGAEFIKGDMTNFSFDDKFSAAVCTLDSVNHLDSADSVKSFLRCVSRLLESGGVFIFDVNSQYKHREILADNTFVYEDDEAYIIWQNEYDEDNSRVKISLDIFEKTGDLYERSCESFFEYDYTSEQITDMLFESGFELICVSGGFDMEDIDEYTERYFIIARKAE